MGFYQKNTGFLRGKLYENFEENYIEVNSIKTKNQKIIDIMKKNENSKQEKDMFSIEENKIANHKRNSMIRSPLNKYTFIKIDENQRKTLNFGEEKTLEKKPSFSQGKFFSHEKKQLKNREKKTSFSQEKMTIFEEKNGKNEGIEKIQQRIQSSKGLSHKRGNSTITMTNTSQKNQRRNSSNELQGLLNKSFGEAIVHELKRPVSSSIYRTKHNMFFFVKKK